MIWHRTRDNPPTEDLGVVLTHRARTGYRLENATDVRLFPHMFPWWTELTPPPKEG